MTFGAFLYSFMHPVLFNLIFSLHEFDKFRIYRNKYDAEKESLSNEISKLKSDLDDINLEAVGSKFCFKLLIS